MKSGRSYSYLDFVGRPSYTIQDLKSLETDRIIEIQYELDNLSIVKKPLIIFGVLFSLMLAGIILNRLKLEAFEDHELAKKRS